MILESLHQFKCPLVYLKFFTHTIASLTLSWDFNCEVILCVKSPAASRHVTNQGASSSNHPPRPSRSGELSRVPIGQKTSWESHTSRSRAASAARIKRRRERRAALREGVRPFLLCGGVSPHRDPLLSVLSVLLLVKSRFWTIWSQNDASRYFWKIVSLRRGCHTGAFRRVHAGETSRSVRKQKGNLFFLKRMHCYYSAFTHLKEISADLFVFLGFFFKLKVFQTNYGKAETCAHQRESGPAEDPHHGSSEERCKDINPNHMIYL